MIDRRRALLSAAGGAQEISGAWGRLYVETVTAGENTVANMTAATNYIGSLRSDTTGVIIEVRRINAESPTPTSQEYGGIHSRSLTSPQGSRYGSNNQWNNATTIGTNYDAHIQQGSKFEVVSIVQNLL